MKRTNGDFIPPLSSGLIKESAYELGADIAGIAVPSPVQNQAKFKDWLNKGYAGEMTYLIRHQEERFNPGRLLMGAQSIITIGVNYYPAAEELRKKEGPFCVAKYAWGEDYHSVLRRLLRSLRNRLRTMRPLLTGRICIDTAPFLDKYWAQMAGLGWQGKHTNLVSREYGSWLLVGSLIIDAAVDIYDTPHRDYCGNCRACIDSCPTGALVSPYELDATRCISYWTIESGAAGFPDNIKKHLGHWAYGCDICLSACPFNRFQKPHRHKSMARKESISLIESGQAADLSDGDFKVAFSGSPLLRPGYGGIKRNIAMASE
jgi:epoxyqueuosine reductase